MSYVPGFNPPCNVRASFLEDDECEHQWANLSDLFGNLQGAYLVSPNRQRMVVLSDRAQISYYRFIDQIFKLKPTKYDRDYLAVARHFKQMLDDKKDPLKASVLTVCFMNYCGCTVSNGCKEARLLKDGSLSEETVKSSGNCLE